MELMRHESIDTTMKFYVGRNAQRTADLLWAEHEKRSEGGTSGCTGSQQAPTPRQEFVASDDADSV